MSDVNGIVECTREKIVYLSMLLIISSFSWIEITFFLLAIFLQHVLNMGNVLGGIKMHMSQLEIRHIQVRILNVILSTCCIDSLIHYLKKKIIQYKQEYVLSLVCTY